MSLYLQIHRDVMEYTKLPEALSDIISSYVSWTYPSNTYVSAFEHATPNDVNLYIQKIKTAKDMFLMGNIRLRLSYEKLMYDEICKILGIYELSKFKGSRYNKNTPTAQKILYDCEAGKYADIKLYLSGQGYI